MSSNKNILDKIVEAKREEVEALKSEESMTRLERLIANQTPARSLSEALSGDGVSLIAEVKKASPSKGLLVADFDPVRLAKIYAKNGASAISVLTDAPHFQGSLQHIKSIKDELGTGCPPVLRKDFIFDRTQVYESRAWGADALLLIVAILSEDDIAELIGLARKMGMECLVETHNEDEMEVALRTGAEIIGINNRDLTTFEVDVETTRRLRPLIPKGVTVVAESGFFTAEDVTRLEGWGVGAVLVGEALVTAPDVGAKVRELAGAIKAGVARD